MNLGVSTFFTLIGRIKHMLILFYTLYKKLYIIGIGIDTDIQFLLIFVSESFQSIITGTVPKKTLAKTKCYFQPCEKQLGLKNIIINFVSCQGRILGAVRLVGFAMLMTLSLPNV
ncbi:hypothetical protein ACJX0J_018215, partial [Zea mays]